MVAQVGWMSFVPSCPGCGDDKLAAIDSRCEGDRTTAGFGPVRVS